MILVIFQKEYNRLNMSDNKAILEMAAYVREMITPAANFMGVYDAKIDYGYGDVCLRDDICWIFDGKVWHELGETESIREPQYVEVIPTNCRNCGAPVHSSGYCPYCGTLNKVKKFNT